MKKVLCSALLILGVSAVFAQSTNQPPAIAEEEGNKAFSTSLSINFLNEYTWRGSISENTPIWQPSWTSSYSFDEYGTLSANIWACLFLTDKDSNRPKRMGGCREVDYTLSYSKSFGNLAFEVGHMWYVYPNQSKRKNSSQELYASVAYNNDILTPSLTGYWDYTDSDNNDPAAFYLYAAVGKTIELTDRLDWEISTGIGMANGAFNTYMTGDQVTDCQFVDYRAITGLYYELTDFMKIGAFARYNWIASPVLRDANYMGDGKDQLLFGGLNLTLNY